MTKQLDLHGLMGYHMKDNIHIFHLVPCKTISGHWNYHKKLQEKVAWSCEHQKVDISPVLSYSTVSGMIMASLILEGLNFLGTFKAKPLLKCYRTEQK